MAIENLIQDFLSYYKIRGFKHQGLIVKKNALLFFTAYLRERLNIAEQEGLKKLTKLDLESFGDYLQAKSLSNDTIRTYGQVAKCFLKRSGLLPDNTDWGKPKKDLLTGLPVEMISVYFEYVEKRKNEGYPASTTGRLAEHARNFLKYLVFERNVTRFIDLRKDDVKDYVKYLADQTDGKGNRLYAPSTLRQKTNLVKPFLIFLSKKGLCAAYSGQMGSVRAEDKVSRNILSRKEVVKLFNVKAENPLEFMLKTIQVVLYSSGVRIGELLALKIEDINFEEQEATIFETKTNKERIVQLGEVGTTYLQIFIENIRPLVCRGFVEGTRAFPSAYEGKIPCNETVNRYLSKACTKAGIKKKITCHCFRHSYGSHLLENGAGIKQVSDLLGHEKLATTERYTKLSPEHLRLTLLKYHPRERDRHE